jgi:hypothetical protein
MFLTGRIFESDKYKDQWRIGSIHNKKGESFPNIFINKEDYPKLEEKMKIQFFYENKTISNLTTKVILSKNQKRTKLKKFENQRISCTGIFKYHSEENGALFENITILENNMKIDHNWFWITDDLKYLMDNGLLEDTKVEFSGVVQKYKDNFNNEKFSLKSFELMHNGDSLNHKGNIFLSIFKLVGFRKFKAVFLSNKIVINLPKNRQEVFKFKNLSLFVSNKEREVQLGKRIILEKGTPKYEFYVRSIS